MNIEYTHKNQTNHLKPSKMEMKDVRQVSKNHNHLNAKISTEKINTQIKFSYTRQKHMKLDFIIFVLFFLGKTDFLVLLDFLPLSHTLTHTHTRSLTHSHTHTSTWLVGHFVFMVFGHCFLPLFSVLLRSTGTRLRIIIFHFHLSH